MSSRIPATRYSQYRRDQHASQGYLRAQLRIESLESRALLSASATSIVARISPAWFESPSRSFAQTEGHSSISADLITQQTDGTGRTVDARANEWIVQIAAESLAGMTSASDAIDLFDGSGISVVRGLGIAGQVLVRATERASDATEWLAKHPAFAYFEPNTISKSTLLPVDDRYSELWGLDNTGQTGGTFDADIDAPEAWNIATGSANIVVGVIDTGVDYNHPDLAGNIWTNPGETPANGIDDDANGFIDDVHGYDFASNDGDPMDDNSHGTHVSGTIAGMGNNGLGVTGVNWSSSIMALKFLDGGGFGTTADAVRAVNYATMMRTTYGVNVRVTNNSWGGGGFSQALFDAIQASGQAGMLFVAAAGNDGLNNDLSPHYPSNYDLGNVIAVAATDHNDLRATFSNFGLSSVDLAAPGVGILSTVPGGGYAAYSGTSMATPHVAGVVALAWSVAPSATSEQIRDAVLAGVDLLPSLDSVIGTGGRLNARRALDQLGLAVAASDPLTGEVVSTLPTNFTIDFTNAFNPATIQASDLRVSKRPANSFVVVDSNTVTFRFTVSPVSSQGPQVMEIDAGSIERLSDGNSITAWFSVFYFDSLRMDVVSTTPAQGEVLAALPGQIILDFNEAFDPTSIDTADLVISGATITAATALDTDSASYSVDYIVSVLDGAVSYTLVSGALLDVHGTPSPGYTGSFVIDDPLINRYESTDVPVDILDLSTVTSTIIIDTPQTIADLDVELSLTHTWDEDLAVVLVAPDGTTRIQLFTHVGKGPNFTGTVLDDEADLAIANGSPPFSGRFRPEGRLSDVDGLNALGTWTLEITDDEEFLVGTLLSWALVIDSGGAASSPIIDDGDPGWQETGEWLLGEGFGHEGDFRLGTDDGMVTTWTFNIAQPGEYRVSATWFRDTALSTMAPFTVIDGAATLGTVHVDQTAFPNDFEDAGSLWENLGLFSITASTLTVRLTVTGANGWVIADAIRIERLGDLPVVTRFESADVPKAILDLSTITSTLTINSPLTIKDLDVELTLTHTYDSDLDVFLIAPGGTRIQLFTDVGGNGDNFTGTILDDEATNTIATASAPFTGRFRPERLLAAADGLNPVGTWTLEITDDAGMDVGTLVSWALVITSDAHLAPPAIIDDGEPGFSLTGDWTAGSGPGVGRNNKEYIAFGESNLPTDIATWTFDLAGGPGRYRVSATWFTNTSFPHLFTDAARFEVSDAETGAVRGATLINQKVFPNDFSDAGSVWEDLAVVDIFGSTLRVRLFSTGDNTTYVVADAIRIEKLADLSPTAEIQVTENGFDVAEDAGEIDFGAANFNQPLQRTFTISNVGMQPLMLTGPITVTGSIFTVVAQPGQSVLDPGESTTFVVQMSATVPGSHSAAVSFGSNDGDEDLFQFSVSGSVRATHVIDDSSPGYFHTGDFQSVPLSIARDGDISYAHFQQNPASEAFWTFNVTPGQYLVAATWFDTAGSMFLTTRAPFTVFDGATPEGTFNLNQRNGPDDYFADGSFWESIGGVFTINSTTLTVKLGIIGADGHLLADAVRLVRLESPGIAEPGSNAALRDGNGATNRTAESDALDQPLPDETYWDDELEDVATLLAEDSTRDDSFSEPVAAGRSGEVEEVELEPSISEWL